MRLVAATIRIDLTEAGALASGVGHFEREDGTHVNGPTLREAASGQGPIDQEAALGKLMRRIRAAKNRPGYEVPKG